MTKLFPEEDLTSYHGSQIVPAMFALLTAISTVRSLVHIWKKDGGAQSIASIPLDKYPANAANTIILMFAYWGQSQLLSLLYSSKYTGRGGGLDDFSK